MALATQTAHGISSSVLPPDKRVGYAVVGLGKLALGEVLPAFGAAKLAKPVALVSGHPEKAKRVAAQYGISDSSIYNYDDYDRISDNPEIQCVYIALPNSMHAEFTIRAALAGKHVLCEKPMAMNTLECEQMIKTCQEKNCKLMIAYRIQYEPFNQLMRQWLQQKELGQVKTILSENSQNISDPNVWRLKKSLSGSGAMADIGIYCLNTSRFLVGEEPVEIMANVYSTPGDPRFREVEESVFWTMRFPSGITAQCSCSFGQYLNRRYRVIGDQAWAELNPSFSYRGLRLFKADTPENGDEVVQEIRLQEKDQFALELDHMAECILEDKQPATPGEEGLTDHKLMEKIFASAEQGRLLKLESPSF